MKLKFDLNYCLFIILVIVLLYSVLGNNVYEGLDTSAKPTEPGCYVKSTTECARPDGNGGWKNGSGAGFNSWANYGYLTFPETTSTSTPAEIAKSKAAIAAGMSPADQNKKCNSTGMLSWCSNSDKAVGKYPKMDWEVVSIPYPKGTDYRTKPTPPSAPPAGTPGTPGTPGPPGPQGPQGIPGTDIHHKTNHHLGGDTDLYGCKLSAGEFWCNSKQSCIQPPDHCPPNNQTNNQTNNCGEGTFWDKVKQACLPHSNKCGNGTVWNKDAESCVPYKQSGSRSDNPTDDNYNYHNNYKSDFESGKHSLENDFESGKHDLENEFESGKNDIENELGFNKSNQRKQYPASRSQIPSGQGNQYMLKSQIVPPVCPACPPVTACGSNKKQQPCPGCARCPEPAFDCKKVPNYNSTNTNYLPKPLLNDFSQF